MALQDSPLDLAQKVLAFGKREAELLQALVVFVQADDVLGRFRAIVVDRDELDF